MPVRVSHFADALIAYMLGHTGAHRDYSSVMRAAIEHYVINHPDFDRGGFMRLLAAVASDLQDNSHGLGLLLTDAARVLETSADEIELELGLKERN
jgi:hypothetical protein